METGGELAYALNMFIGLIVFNLFNECMCSSAGIIRSNPNFVKKVIFPLEVMGISIVTGAIVQAIVSIGVFGLVALLGLGYIPWTVIFLPIVIFPMIVACFALSWIMSGIGVFFKDIDQILPVASSALMFGSAVFYPLEVLPINIRGIFELNLIALTIEEARKVALMGQLPDFMKLLLVTILTVFFSELVLKSFNRVKGEFADAL